MCLYADILCLKRIIRGELSRVCVYTLIFYVLCIDEVVLEIRLNYTSQISTYVVIRRGNLRRVKCANMNGIYAVHCLEM